VLEREHERLWGVRVHQMHALQERPYIHVELAPVDLVNDPRRIAREEDFISINATTDGRPLRSARAGDDRGALLVSSGGRPASRGRGYGSRR
jgi:hypothetical protein